ncbi:MAG: hypothetical protein M0P66_15045, partial [Salinivirgaceae bacterium]|nr:hypothetical protein [Salinivirgaceae bacterium]
AGSKTYSHLPIGLKNFIEQELRNPEQKTGNVLIGNVYIEFFVDENCQIQVVGLSSSNTGLGEFVKNELMQLPSLNINCPKGVVYEIKVRLAYT